MYSTSRPPLRQNPTQRVVMGARQAHFETSHRHLQGSLMKGWNVFPPHTFTGDADARHESDAFGRRDS